MYSKIKCDMKLINNKEECSDSLRIFCEYACNIPKDASKSIELCEFLKSIRNYLSHAESKLDDDLKKKFIDLLENKDSSLKQRILHHDINDCIEQLLQEALSDSVNVLLVVLSLSLILPTFIIKALTDKILFDNKSWKKILVNISKDNSNYLNFDLSIFTKYPQALINSDTEKQDIENRQKILVKDWNINFIRSSWKFILPLIRGAKNIDLDSIQFLQNMDAVRFRTAVTPPIKYEMSRIVIQQILVQGIFNKEYSIDLSEYITPTNTRKQSSNNKDPYPAYSKILQYYKSWTTKRAWVDSIEENNLSKENHYAIRSFTRYILRECRDVYFDLRTDRMKNKEDQRKYAKKHFGIISRYIHQNINSPLDFNELRDIDSTIISKLKEYNEEYFQNIYQDLCNKQIDKIGEKKLSFIKSYANQDKRLKDFLEPKTTSNTTKTQNKQEDELNWDKLSKEISKKSHPFPALYNPNENEIKRLKLIYSKSVTEYVPKIIKELSKFSKDISTVSSLIPKLKQGKKKFAINELKKNKGIVYTKSEKQTFKKEKEEFFTALECALLYLYVSKQSSEHNNNTQKRIEKIMPLTLKADGEQKPKEKGIYILLGKSKDIKFYSKGDPIYRTFWEEKFNKIEEKQQKQQGRQKISSILSSWLANEDLKKDLEKCKRTTDEGQTVYILNNEFADSFLALYMAKGQKILKWEKKFIKKYPNIKNQNETYISFDDIHQYITKNKININADINNLKKVRNNLFHLNLFSLEDLKILKNID